MKVKQRNLKDILDEAYQKGVTDPEVVKEYIRLLGNRSLFSLMYGKRQGCSEEERYEEWSVLEFVPMEHEAFADFSEEDIVRFMTQVTLKDFLCLSDQPMRERMEAVNQACWLIDDFDPVYERRTAAKYLLRMLLRAKGRGDTDVCNFCRIRYGEVLQLAYNDPEISDNSEKLMADFLYESRDGLKTAEDSEERIKWIMRFWIVLCNCMEEVFAEAYSYDEVVMHYTAFNAPSGV